MIIKREREDWDRLYKLMYTHACKKPNNESKSDSKGLLIIWKFKINLVDRSKPAKKRHQCKHKTADYIPKSSGDQMLRWNRAASGEKY